MRRNHNISLPALLLLFALQQTAAADDLEQVDFDLFVERGNLTALLNLSPFLTSERINNLKDGRHYIVEQEYSLKRPRKIWGSEQAARQLVTLRIEFQIVTESYRLEFKRDGTSRTRQFVSPAGLHRYLSDSIIIQLISVDSLDHDYTYVLEINLNCITSGLIQVGAATTESGKSGSPVKYLFGKFLYLTGYGRQEYQIKSAPFRIRDLDRLD